MEIEKLVEKMRRQPNGIRFAEAEKVLNYYGYYLVRQKGSHVHFLNDKGELLTIKAETHLKKVYIVNILNRIAERGNGNGKG